MLRKCSIEFIGTFFLVLAVAITGNPLAIGAVLTALVYMGGYISGAHYNPAVTLAHVVTGKIPTTEAAYYVVTQLVAAIAAAFTVFVITGSKFIPQPSMSVDFTAAFLIEVFFTFLLAFVVLHVASTTKTKDNNYFGIAIGFTLMTAAFAGGPISGGAFNPAVGIGPLLFDIGALNAYMPSLALYLFGPLLGGALAGGVYKFIASSKER